MLLKSKCTFNFYGPEDCNKHAYVLQDSTTAVVLLCISEDDKSNPGACETQQGWLAQERRGGGNDKPRNPPGCASLATKHTASRVLTATAATLH